MAALCKTCDEGTGYMWDSFYPCPDCQKGKGIQHVGNIRELKSVEKRARQLRKAIKGQRHHNLTRNSHETSRR